MPIYDWKSWLEQWNRELLERFDPNSSFLEDETVTPEVIASGWLGSPGATEAEIVQLEMQLGVPLPPSYREFLAVSDGFLLPGMVVPRLFGTREVEWFLVRNQDVVDHWTYGATLYGDPEGFDLHLPSALEISARETIGTAVYLLNPKVVNESGEWEAVLFAHWVPGAYPYASFWDLMEQQRRDYVSNRPLR